MSRIRHSLEDLVIRSRRRIATFRLPWPGRTPRRLPFHKIDTLIAREQYVVAERELFRLARAHGHDPRIWNRLFEMLWVNVGEADRAGRAHFQAMRTVKDEATWDEIQHLYMLHAERVLDTEDLAYEDARTRRRREAARIENAHEVRPPRRTSEHAWRRADERATDDPALSRGVPRVEG